MNETLVVICVVLSVIAYMLGKQTGAKTSGKMYALGREEGVAVGMHAGQGSALPFDSLPDITCTVEHIAGGTPPHLFAVIRVERQDPLRVEKGEFILVRLNKTQLSAIPEPPFTLAKDEHGVWQAIKKKPR